MGGRLRAGRSEAGRRRRTSEGPPSEPASSKFKLYSLELVDTLADNSESIFAMGYVMDGSRIEDGSSWGRISPIPMRSPCLSLCRF